MIGLIGDLLQGFEWLEELGWRPRNSADKCSVLSSDICWPSKQLYLRIINIDIGNYGKTCQGNIGNYFFIIAEKWIPKILQSH